MPRTRYEAAAAGLRTRELPGAALRAALRDGYGLRELRGDVLAGVTVGIVALPLAMALGIAVGVPPQQGLYASIVAGALVALLGGSRTQVTGPTAAFIVVLVPIVTKFGVAGLFLAGIIGGLILVALGVARFGRFIEFIPHPVTTGFTAGIATVIATLQLKDVLGVQLPAGAPADVLGRVRAMWQARGTISLSELVVAAVTLALLVSLPRVTRRVPAPLLALPVAAALAALLSRLFPGHPVATIANRFHAAMPNGSVVAGVPPLPPLPLLPWHAPGPGGAPFVLSFATLRELLPAGFAVALLGGIESLLSAVIADGMAGTRHDPDAELLALGCANILTPFFGGIPATGAIARTATNIRSGARSPVAAIVHALTVLAAVLALAPLIGLLPMAGLAALLLLVAWNMAEAKHFVHVLRVAPRADVLVLVTCFGLTVLFDMVVAVSVGVVLAALLFMRRMAELTEGKLTAPEADPSEISPALPKSLAGKVALYEIAGPLFFGAAQKAIGSLGRVTNSIEVLILRLDRVPVMDATGLVALESAIEALTQRGCVTILAGLQQQPAELLERAGFRHKAWRLMLRADFASALAAAEELVTASPRKSAPQETQIDPRPSGANG
ncbi:MAG TPA: C4-dicarboxylic acid transporter DauA [Polyangia bacterium]|nr:C4-dicarboxylic acid transporter DauA [Polyangia bacterium]